MGMVVVVVVVGGQGGRSAGLRRASTRRKGNGRVHLHPTEREYDSRIGAANYVTADRRIKSLQLIPSTTFLVFASQNGPEIK